MFTNITSLDNSVNRQSRLESFQPNFNSVNDVSESTNLVEDSFSLQEMIDAHKQNSLTYQLLVAIANQTQKVSETEPHELQIQEFNLNVSQTFNFQAEITVADIQLEFTISLTLDTTGELSISANSQNSQGFRFNLNDQSFNQIQLSSQSQTSNRLSIDIQTSENEQADPLILNLDNSDFSFNSNLINFDLNADGKIDKITQLAQGNSYLAIDTNGNGKIDDGRELFGDALGSKDGFIELAKHDDNQDGVIDANDRVFKHLLLLNFDDKSEQKLVGLSTTDIESISLNKIEQQRQFDNNLLIAKSEFNRKDGSSGLVGDFLLGLNPI